MGLGFPSGSTDLKFTKFKKNWRFDSTTNSWRMEPISGSFLNDLEDVDALSPADGAFLVLTGSTTWVPKLFTGSFTGSYFKSYVFNESLSESIVTFTDSNNVETSIALPQNVYAEENGFTGSLFGYTLKDSDSGEILFESASYAVTAANAETANTVEFYPFDNYVEGVNLSSNQLYYSMSYGIDTGDPDNPAVTLFSASINKYTNTKTIVGRNPDENGNVNVTLNTVITGTLAERPLSSVDGDLYVLANETGSRFGNNGTAFLYSEEPDDWFEVTPPSQEAADARYAERSGSVMLGNLRAFDLAISGSEPATLAYTNAKVPTKDTNLRAFRTVTSFDLNPAYNTWTDLEFDTTDVNDTGGTITTGVYEVPATGVTRMTFSAGANIRHGGNSSATSTHIRIVLNGTRIIAEQSHIFNPNGRASWRDEGANVSSGLIAVSPGDLVKVQVKRGWNNRTKIFSRGTDDLNTGNYASRSGGTYFCGVINDTPPGAGITGMLGGDGIEVTGDVENKVVATDATVLRRDIANSITANQSATGNITGTGSLVVNGNASMQEVVFSGSAFLTGDIQLDGLGNYVSDVEAAANGVAIGKLYKNNNQIMVRVS